MRLFGPLSVLMPLLQNRLAQAENRLLRMGHDVSSPHVVFCGRATLKGPKSRMWLELGLVITGTLPVFNITGQVENKTNLKNQLILGVMGVDVSLEDIKRLTPRFTPIGVGIPTINLRKRRPNVQNPKSQEPVTLDFLDAELENDIKVEIRNKMIDGENGEKSFRTLVKSQDERYIDKGNRTYTWTPVNGTDYSLALVLPTYSFYYIKAKIEETITQARYSETLKPDNFEESGYTFLAPSKGVKARFVVTDGGITRVYPKELKNKNDEPFPLRAGENWQENPETYEDSFYKRSLDNDNYVFTAPYFNKSGPGAYESGIMCAGPVCDCKRNSDVMDCVILDDGGFLLMANHDDYTNQVYSTAVYLEFDFSTASGGSEMEDEEFTASISKQSCITEQTQYFFDNDSSLADGPDPCVMVKQPRYRKGPEVCFDNNDL
ncbi:hypothetical protein QTO34_004514, partial [Cnephaeus nilssonii]